MAREQYQTTWKDYDEILQVHLKAEPEVISAAYRRLALMYHPDKNHSPGAEQRFKEINEASLLIRYFRKAKLKTLSGGGLYE